jgi:hypothetical protein
MKNSKQTFGRVEGVVGYKKIKHARVEEFQLEIRKPRVNVVLLSD